MQNFFLVVEGLSGSGKTTIGKELAKQTRSIFYKTPPLQFELLRHWIDQKVDPTVRYLFYLTSVLQASCDIREILQKHSVVCDRYLLTTECYHKIIGVQTFGGYKKWQDQIVIPDITILVTCSEYERQQRLSTRGLSFNDSQEEKLQIATKLYKEYRHHPVVEINNDGNIEDTVDKILNELQKRSLWRG